MHIYYIYICVHVCVCVRACVCQTYVAEKCLTNPNLSETLRLL